MKAISLFTFTLLFLSVSLAEKLKIEVFMESLCPDSRDFVRKSLKKAFYTENIEYLAEFSIFPYGNAHQAMVENTWSFECQHGADECQGNLMENCAINKTDSKTGMEFVICFEENVETLKDIEEIGKKCSENLQLDFTAIKDCMNNGSGSVIQHFIADQTEALQPPKKYVPWILVNGNHDTDAENEIIENMLGYICKNYKGDASIDACKGKRTFLKF